MPTGSSSMDEEDDGLENPVPAAMEAMIAAESVQAYSHKPQSTHLAPAHAVMATPDLPNFPAPTSDAEVKPSVPAYLSFPTTPFSSTTPIAASAQSAPSAEATPELFDAVRNLFSDIPKPIAPSPTSNRPVKAPSSEDDDGQTGPSFPVEGNYEVPAIPLMPSSSQNHIAMQTPTSVAFHPLANPMTLSSKVSPTRRPTPSASRHHGPASGSASSSATPTTTSKGNALGGLSGIFSNLPILGNLGSLL